MKKPRKSAKELEAEMLALRDELKAAKEKEEIDFGKMARKIGLFDLNLTSAEMKTVLEDAKARFQSSAGATGANAGRQASSEDRTPAT